MATIFDIYRKRTGSCCCHKIADILHRAQLNMKFSHNLSSGLYKSIVFVYNRDKYPTGPFYGMKHIISVFKEFSIGILDD